MYRTKKRVTMEELFDLEAMAQAMADINAEMLNN